MSRCNQLSLKIRNKLSRGFRILSDYFYADDYFRLEDLLFQYAHNSEEQYCFVASCEKDVSALNALSKARNMRGFCVVCEHPWNLRSVFQRISWDDITGMKFSTVVIPTLENEIETEMRLRALAKESEWEFSIWDPYAYFLAGQIYSGVKHNKSGFVRKRYRDVTLSLSEGNIVLPHYYGNWGFINHITKNEICNGLNVLDMWSGSGCIGLSLKKENPTISVDLADINYFAILAIRESIKLDSELAGCRSYLSDVFDQIPIENKYDIIVGNPPCGLGFANDFIQIGGADEKWRSHKSFFNNAHKYLKQAGKICLVEQLCENKKHTAEYAEQFYENLLDQFPQYSAVSTRPLRGTFFSTVTVTKG